MVRNGIGKLAQNKTISKTRKNIKNKTKRRTKTSNEQTDFCSQTVLSLYLKVRAQKLTTQNHRQFFVTNEYQKPTTVGRIAFERRAKD